jgi:hypothetical protein
VLNPLAADRILPALRRLFAAALQAVAAGSRDLARADSPDLDFHSTVELRLLIESLISAPATD